MIRHTHAARAAWRERLEEIGFRFHSIDEMPYWDETASWEFSAAEIDQLDDAAMDVHRLALTAAETVIAGGYLAKLGIRGRAAKLIERSWENREPVLYGRFDVAWDGNGAPKFLEYNADTPTSLYEAAVVQWHWLEELHPGADQFNSLHEALVARWREIATSWDMGDRLHLASMVPHLEDEGTVEYLKATAQEAGLSAQFIGMRDIGWDGRKFVDLERRAIRHLFKLYPWEWLVEEPFAAHVADAGTRFIEPAWKLVLANKALFAVMWELFPDHPNLLPAALARSNLPRTHSSRVVSKPLFGREGSNVRVFEGDTVIAQTEGPYGRQPVVWQEWTPLATCGGDPVGSNTNALLGLWMIGDRCCGLGIREDHGLITGNSGRFVPHFFR